MFAVRSSLRRASYPLMLAVTAVAVIGLAGCGDDKVVDPYVYTTLERVMAGDTLSNDFLFEIDAPQLEYAKGDVGIIRKGNQLHFLVGPDLENNYASYAGKILGVQKRFEAGNQNTHLYLKRTRSGEMITPVDSLPPTYILPRVRTDIGSELETPGAPLPDLDWQRPSKIEEYLPQEEGASLLKVQSIIETLVYMPRHDLTEEQKATPGAGDYSWYAVFPKSTFRIVDLKPGADYMFELLRDQNLPLVGSFSLASVEDRRTERRKVHGDLGHVCGTMKVNWFRYGNAYVTGN